MTKKKKEFITNEQRYKFEYICTQKRITFYQAASLLLINTQFLNALLLGCFAITKQEKEMFIKKGFDLWK